MTSTSVAQAPLFASPIIGGDAIYEALAQCDDKRYDLTLPDTKAKGGSCVPQTPPSEMITIDPESGVPIWFQLRNRLIYLIASGRYGVGDKLPTVRELAVDLGVNYNTVSKVYQDIERDGYIVSKRGKGTFVAERKDEGNTSDLDEVDALTDDYIRQCVELGVPPHDIVALIERRLSAQY